MIKKIIKYGVYASCFIAFIYFSWQTLIGFVNGAVVYDVVNDNDAQPGFPSVTLCPKYRKSLVNLKTGKMKSDLGLNSSAIESFTIYGTLAFQNTTPLVEKYSFSKHETLFGSLLHLHEYTAYTKFVSEEMYEEEKEAFLKCQEKDSSGNKIQSCKAPIIFKEIKIPIGKCFYLYTEEKATTEQKFQGWTIEMKSDVDGEDLYWEVYIGYNGIPHPTYSMSISHEMFQLKPRSETFVVFSLEQDTVLSKHGWFQSKQYCSAEASNIESIACFKACLLDHHKE